MTQAAKRWFPLCGRGDQEQKSLRSEIQQLAQPPCAVEWLRSAVDSRYASKSNASKGRCRHEFRNIEHRI